MNDVIPIYKPLCLTPLQAIDLFRSRFPALATETISYAGRLDPMAEGILLLLIGKANKERRTYENLRKIYSFSFILGITTDTYDVLGRITSYQPVPITAARQISHVMKNYQGAIIQTYPPYSSKTVNGKPLYWWAREGKLSEITLPTKKVHITSLSLLAPTSLPAKECIDEIKKRVTTVKGNFRQQAVLNDWEQLEGALPRDHSLPLISCEATVSSGTYIRSLIAAIGNDLGCGAVAYRIKRTQVGNFTLGGTLRL